MKKFYENVSVKKENGKYKIFLDENELRTPMKNELVTDYEMVASNLAMEWKEQKEEVKPETMPYNRYANSIIDRIIPNKKEIINELIEYASSDVICYRDGSNAELLKIQDEKWNPILKWFDKKNVHLEVSYEVFPIDQDKKSLEELRKMFELLSNEYLGVLYLAASISKSTLLAYYYISGKITGNQLYEFSMLEELWQAEKWGKDEEAEENRMLIKKDLGELGLFKSIIFNSFYILIDGRVQNVGYRRFVEKEFLELGNISGAIRNREDGKVEIIVLCENDKIIQVKDICSKGSALTKVINIEVKQLEDSDYSYYEAFGGVQMGKFKVL